MPARRLKAFRGVTSPWSRKGRYWGQLCNPLQPGLRELWLVAAKRLQALRLVEGNRALACSSWVRRMLRPPTRPDSKTHGPDRNLVDGMRLHREHARGIRALRDPRRGGSYGAPPAFQLPAAL